MKDLEKEYDRLQQEYGEKSLHSVYGYGDRNPEIVLVFMNPTKRNIATEWSWKGIRAQWLGTKPIWAFLTKADLLDGDINNMIQSMRPNEWTEAFCEKVYENVKKHKVWITNLAKCTQDDARPLPDKIFAKYLDLLLEEVYRLDPSKIILFGNQVSSIVLNKNISVSSERKKSHTLTIKDKTYSAYPVYYPVGNGRFNQDKALEDLKYILSK